jgi:L-fuconolactonase
MIIDSHVHFWKFDPMRDSWITDDMSVIGRDFYPQDIHPELSANYVDGCIAVQAVQNYGETEFLLALAEENPFIKGVVGWVDLKSHGIEAQLQHCSTIKKLKGFRHIAEGHPEGFLIGDAFVNGIKALQQYGHTYDILIRQHQLAEAIALVDKVPEQPFILDHCGKPDLKDNAISGWEAHIKIIAQNPNVHCKLSGLLTQCHWHNWAQADIYNCLDIIFENFGTGRVLFGSDWPVMLLAGNYTQWLTLIKKYTARFSAEEQENIFSGNATQFYNL